MTTKHILLAVSLLVPAAIGGCDMGKSSGGATVTSSATPTAAAGGASCPGGSTLSAGSCLARGQSRVATIAWNGTFSGDGPIFTLKNTTSSGLRKGTVSLWFYDRSGKRLDASGAKKWSSSADIFSGTMAASSSRETTFGFPRANLPDGTAQIEGEIVAVTLASADGSDGPGWKNDDLNADERVMVNPPSATAPVAAAGAGPRPGTAPGAPTMPTGATPTPGRTPTPGAAPAGATPTRGSGPAATVPAGQKPGGPSAPPHH
jgi:hypothetical protein